MKKLNIQGFLVGQVIAAALGALLLFVDDFAGYYHGNYYLRIQEYGYIYLGSGILSSILILMAAGGLLLALYSAAVLLKKGDKASPKLIEKNATNSIVGGIVASGIAVIGGIIFAVSNIIDQTEEWWFDSGFYGALIGGILVIFFAKMVLDHVKK